jgi:putative endonuclease
MFFTYVLYSINFNKIYIGYSSDAKKRLAAHNDKRNSGWTKKYQPWVIIHLENFETKTEALKREKQLKTSRGRDFIRGIISAL